MIQLPQRTHFATVFTPQQIWMPLGSRMMPMPGCFYLGAKMIGALINLTLLIVDALGSAAVLMGAGAVI